MNELNAEKLCRTCINESLNMINIKDSFIDCSGVQVPVTCVLQIFAITDVRLSAQLVLTAV